MGINDKSIIDSFSYFNLSIICDATDEARRNKEDIIKCMEEKRDQAYKEYKNDPNTSALSIEK